MKNLSWILLLLFFLKLGKGLAQNATLPGWVSDSLKSKGLDQKYVPDAYLSPSFLQGD